VSDSGEYVPTTFIVSERYAQGQVGRWAEFDRWLTANNAAVREAAVAEGRREVLRYFEGFVGAPTMLIALTRKHFKLEQLASGEETGATDE
jgi:hypothetical protein